MFQQVKAEVQSTLAPLVREILSDVEHLFAQELALWKAEMRSEMRQFRSAAIAMGAGFSLCFIALQLLCAAVVLFLHSVFPAAPLWLCCLAVALVVLLFGGIAIRQALKARAHPITPQTIDSLKETVQWAKQQL